MSAKFPPDDPTVFSRPRWRHAMRMFGATVVIFLNIGLIMSVIDRHMQGLPLNFEKELVSIFFVLIIDAVILLPSMLEVDMLRILDDGLLLKLLFFTKFVPYSKVIAFQRPRWLKLAIVKTERCFYLINKREIREFDKLEQNIAAKRESAALKRVE